MVIDPAYQYRHAENEIQRALQSGATRLYLGDDYKVLEDEKLSELPESLWKLKTN